MQPEDEDEEEEEEDDDDDEAAKAQKRTSDRAELLHLLQDFELLGRGEPPDIVCGIFVGVGQQLPLAEFKHCVARSALALMPTDSEEDYGDPPDKLRAMRARLEELNKANYEPDRGKGDPALCTIAEGQYKGFYGPWIGV